jgi:hypothetical protein
LQERGDLDRRFRIVHSDSHKHADAPHSLALLPTRNERPRRCAAEPSDEFAPSKAKPHLPLPSP